MSEMPVIKGELRKRRRYLLKLLNAVVKMPGGEDMYDKMGSVPMLKLSEEDALALEETFPELGIRSEAGNYYVTVASLLATVTDVLCDRRVAFHVEDKGQGPTTGFGWYRDTSKDRECGRCGEVLKPEECKRLDPEDDYDYCEDCIEIVAHGGK